MTCRGGHLEHRVGARLDQHPTRRNRVPGGDHPSVAIEEDHVDREPHPERVDAAAARDQQAGAGAIAVEQREAEQPSDRAVRDADMMAGDGRPRPAAEAARDSIAIRGHDMGQAGSRSRCPPTRPLQAGVQGTEGSSARRAHT
jgi:hypothetical protein